MPPLHCHKKLNHCQQYSVPQSLPHMRPKQQHAGSHAIGQSMQHILEAGSTAYTERGHATLQSNTSSLQCQPEKGPRANPQLHCMTHVAPCQAVTEALPAGDSPTPPHVHSITRIIGSECRHRWQHRTRPAEQHTREQHWRPAVLAGQGVYGQFSTAPHGGHSHVMA